MHCGNVETYINRAVVREYPVEKNIMCGNAIEITIYNYCGKNYTKVIKHCKY